MATTIEPAKATTADKFHSIEPIKEACTNSKGGHWDCLSHPNAERPYVEGRNHKSQMGGALDWREDCKAVWVCHEHGPEVP